MLSRRANKILIFILVLCLLSGCAGLQRKFARRPKEKEKPAPVVQTFDYSKELRVDELYRKHFLFWKSWHTELVERLEEGYKKRTVCFEHLVYSIKTMKKYLMEQKAQELEIFIADIEALGSKITQKHLSASEAYSIRTVLEKTGRQVEKRFSYSDVKEFLEFKK